MTFITETVEKKPSALIVYDKNTKIIPILKQELKKYNVDVFVSPVLAKNLEQFDYIFSINKEIKTPHKKIILIYLNNLKAARILQEKNIKHNLKIISADKETLNKNDVDRILWFAFSKTNEHFLHLSNMGRSYAKKKFNLSSFHLPSRKSIIIWAAAIILILHFAFILPISLSTFFLYKGATSFRQEKFDQTSNYLSLAEPTLKLAKTLYSFSRPSFLIFSLALFPDNVFAVNQKTDETLNLLLNMEENGKQIVTLVLNKDKTQNQVNELSLRIGQFKNTGSQISDDLLFLSQKIPPSNPFLKIKNELSNGAAIISDLNNLLDFSDSLLARGTEKKYLLLFANNMELRPGGGFIGSFGVLTMNNYTLSDLKIYDVYDADGQLTAHVDPPTPIRNYLNQPNWFLRDSAFSPDFLENYDQAKFFLAREMNFNDFSGAFLITTSAVQNILGAFGDIYLPDYNEKVNQNNFYLKAQIYAENDFFPGSTQKKNFLGTLTHYLLLNMDNVSFQNLAKGIKKSLDEKQIVVYLDDPKVQKFFDTMYWSGRLIEPKCSVNVTNCVTDFIYPFDANLGVNKANFYLTRTFDLNVNITKNGDIDHVFSATFNNDSPTSSFPGGDYKNYFQIFLPIDSEVKNITQDGTLVENYDETNDVFKKIGFFFNVKPKNLTKIKISYVLNSQIRDAKNIYQLVVQKQIGSSNSDLSLNFSLPKNINIVNQNFSSLVKNGEIVYNTSLSTDKIFFMELNK